MNYKGRLIFELLDVSENIIKLQNSLKTNEIENKDKECIELLNRQLSVMDDYKTILVERIMKEIGGYEECSIK